MFSVMVVDDEPYAQQHICSIIEQKCPHYRVAATAENGAEALEALRSAVPDVIISDVKMPRMDGIELAARLKQEYPDVLTIIVSGYQDFEYAKGAIQSGVCDYLLKPLKPSDLKELLDRLVHKLTAQYYAKRTQLMRAMCNNDPPEAGVLMDRYFPSDAYYAAILRKNGLPKRFSRQTGIEIFSTEDENVLLYGRDEMEALYLFPQELLAGKSFADTVKALFESEQSEYYYVTAVMHPDAFDIFDFSGVVKKLYRKLDESLVIGKNQIVQTDRQSCPNEMTVREQEQRERVEYLIRYKDTGKLLAEFETLLDLWEQSQHNQIFVESHIRAIVQRFGKQSQFIRDYGEYTFLIDDAFFYVANMQELKIEMKELLTRLDPSLGAVPLDDREQLFGAIVAYLDLHFAQPLTLNNICQRFGVSQSTLSKLFRKYKNNSFSNYLTEVRIEKAKHILQQDKTSYIKDVAERVGYPDQFYFSRIFRSVVGVCPREYVAQME